MSERLQEKADAARDAVRRGIDYLVDKDGYDRETIQDFVDSLIADYFDD